MAAPVGGEAARRRQSGAVHIKLQLDERALRNLRAALRAVGTDSPEIREAFEEAVDSVLIPALRSAAPGSMGRRVKRGVVSKAALGTSPRVNIKVRHPGAASYEFGRKYWYRGWKGRARGKGSIKGSGASTFRSRRGQRARPWVGVQGGGALAAARPQLISALEGAIERTWRRLQGSA